MGLPVFPRSLAPDDYGGDRPHPRTFKPFPESMYSRIFIIS
jgi:hypothetical protein